MMSSKKPVEFWFDFSSPYAYLASAQIEEIADEHGRSVVWRPFLLGAVFKETGAKPNVDNLFKKEYMGRDVPRFARLYEMDFVWPDPFPVSTLIPARIFYWVERYKPEKAADFVGSVFDAFFSRGHNIAEKDVALDVASKIGLDRAVLDEALEDSAIKERLKGINDEAVRRKIFGAPVTVVDGEMFWGADRLWMVEEWLQSGGW